MPTRPPMVWASWSQPSDSFSDRPGSIRSSSSGVADDVHQIELVAGERLVDAVERRGAVGGEVDDDQPVFLGELAIDADLVGLHRRFGVVIVTQRTGGLFQHTATSRAAVRRNRAWRRRSVGELRLFAFVVGGEQIAADFHRGVDVRSTSPDLTPVVRSYATPGVGQPRPQMGRWQRLAKHAAKRARDILLATPARNEAQMVRRQSTWPAERGGRRRGIIASCSETPKIGWKQCRDSAVERGQRRGARPRRAGRNVRHHRSRETEGFCGNPPIIPAGPDIVSHISIVTYDEFSVLGESIAPKIANFLSTQIGLLRTTSSP